MAINLPRLHPPLVMPTDPVHHVTEKAATQEHSQGNGLPTATSQSPETLKDVCDSLHRRIQAFLSKKFSVEDRLHSVQQQTRTSLDIIAQALDRYSLESLSLSYNGGKDCLVLLIIYLAALSTRHPLNPPSDSPKSHPHTNSPPHSPFPPLLQSVYIQPPHPFPDVDAFVATSSATYNLELSHYSLPMRDAFEVYLQDKPKIRAILVGTRRTDPHGGQLGHFAETDGRWPRFMRVHPVIDWHYAEIWAFIRHLEIPYCPLYDMGYTSLGGTTDTHPNPALRVKGEDGVEVVGEGAFRPAYELVMDEEERLGRDW